LSFLYILEPKFATKLSKYAISVKIVPVTDDDTLMSKKIFLQKIDSSLQQANEGKIKKTNIILSNHFFIIILQALLT